LELFERIERVEDVVLVAGSDDMLRCRRLVCEYGIRKVRTIVPGGDERQQSVYNGLMTLSADVRWVAVHDGVRPFVTESAVNACLSKAEQTGAAVLAVPVKDTIKVVGAAGQIESTPDRRSLWAIQTPQTFRVDWLLEAHERARRDGFIGTDDAALVERLGKPVHVVEGEYTNIKITTPEDLWWAETILANSGRRTSDVSHWTRV
jgi:2-C-methyl-D-erythritol 4-phosphate cytidylyltransferase